MVVQEPVYMGYNETVKGYKTNVSSSDRKVLGVVSGRYRGAKNTNAFSFTNELFGKDACYEAAGSLQERKRVWHAVRFVGWKSINGKRESCCHLY